MSATDPLFNPASLFELHISPGRRFAEIVLRDAEDSNRCAATGYMDAEDREAVVARLRGIISQLEALAPCS